MSDKRKFHKRMLKDKFSFIHKYSIPFKECHIISAKYKDDKKGFFNEACALMDRNVLDVKVNDKGETAFTYPYTDPVHRNNVRVKVNNYSKDSTHELDENIVFKSDAKVDIERIL